MNKILPLAFTFFLALAGMQVSAENWIKNADGSPSWIDTDSIRQEQAISSFDMRLESSDFTVVSTMEFDTSKNTWRTAALVTRDKDGKVLHAEKKENPDDGWNKLMPGTYGKNLYRHYVETPLPPSDAKWKQLYKDNRGTAFSIDTNSLRYKNGYADPLACRDASRSGKGFIPNHLSSKNKYGLQKSDDPFRDGVQRCRKNPSPCCRRGSKGNHSQRFSCGKSF